MKKTLRANIKIFPYECACTTIVTLKIKRKRMPYKRVVEYRAREHQNDFDAKRCLNIFNNIVSFGFRVRCARKADA